MTMGRLTPTHFGEIMTYSKRYFSNLISRTFLNFFSLKKLLLPPMANRVNQEKN